MASAFGYNIAPGTTAEDLALRRRIGEQLLMQASGGPPIKHWSQGLNKIAQGLVGGYDVRKATEGDKAQNEEATRLLGGLFDLGEGEAPSNVYAPPGGQSGGGSPVSAIRPAASPAAQAQVGNITDRIVNAESGGRSNLKNPNSSASGPGQFTDSTWLDMIQKNRPDLMQGRSREQVLAMRTDPDQAQLSKDMTGAYERENAGRLRAAGLEPTPANLYAMHFFGPGDGIKVLRATPNTKLEGLVSPASIEANPFLRGMTVGRAQRWAAGKMGGGEAAPAASSSSKADRRAQRAVALWGNPQTRPLAQAILAKYLTKDQDPTELMREYEMARSQGYSGSILEYQKELKTAGKTDSALTDDLKEYQYAVGQGGFKGSYAEWEGMKKQKGLSPGDKKAINEAEDAVPVISGTLANLEKALVLNAKAFTGIGAETGAAIGTSGLPGASYLVDKERAEATREWMALMRPEAIQNMASTLTGATTNFELQEFVKVLADPSTPVKQRETTIKRMIDLARGKERIAKERLQQIRDGSYYQPGGGSSDEVEFTRGPDGKLRRK